MVQAPATAVSLGGAENGRIHADRRQYYDVLIGPRLGAPRSGRIMEEMTNARFP